MSRLLGRVSSWSALTVVLAGLGLTGPAAAQPRAAGTAGDPPGEPYREAIPGTAVTFEMIPVPGGSVEVPGPDGTRRVDVGPVWMSRTEVTWDAYDVFALGLDGAGTTPEADAVARPSRPYGAPGFGWGHAGYPAINITRAAAEAYCEWLSAVTGRTYRVPTEAEWLHAASLATGGEPIALAGLDALAWHAGNAGGQTHAVASKEPDALGLHDLFGNVAEWVMTGDGRLVTRGGSFRDPPSAVAVAMRAVQDPSWTERDPQLPRSRWWLSDAPFVGFRIVRDP